MWLGIEIKLNSDQCKRVVVLKGAASLMKHNPR